MSSFFDYDRLCLIYSHYGSDIVRIMAHNRREPVQHFSVHEDDEIMCFEKRLGSFYAKIGKHYSQKIVSMITLRNLEEKFQE